MIAIQEQMPSSVCVLELHDACSYSFHHLEFWEYKYQGSVFHSLFKLEHFNTDEIGNCTAMVIPPVKHKHRTPSIQKFPAETSPKQLQQTLPQP